MGRKSIDRIEEKGINDFGSEMIIVNSYMKFNDKHKRNYTYIDVYLTNKLNKTEIWNMNV